MNSMRRWFWKLKYSLNIYWNYLNGYEKIRFREQTENLEDDEFERIWAKRLGSNLYRIENVPFTDQLNLHDIVKCKESPDDFAEIVEIVSRSGNRTLRVEFREETTAENAVEVIMALKEKRVFYEKAGWRIYNFNVEPSINHDAIRDFLKSKEEEGLLWLYE